MGLWNKLTGVFTKAQKSDDDRPKSSKGERVFMSLLPSYAAGMPAMWAQQRAELARHFTGWPFVAINALCEECAGMHPLLARVTDGQDLKMARAKALTMHDPHERRAFLMLARAKYLSQAQRAKALAHLQPHEELEPIGRDHPMLRMLRKPNPYDTSWTFVYRLFMFLRVTGVSYILVIKNNAGQPCQLWSLPSHWVYKIPSATELIDHWEIRPAIGYAGLGYAGTDWGWFAGGGGVKHFPADSIIEIAYPNPLNPFDGYAPSQACADWVEAAENVDRCRTAHFKNGWFPGIVIILDKDVTDPDPNQIARLQAEIMNRYQGVMKTGKPVVLGPGMTMAPASTTPVEMDYAAGADQLMKFGLAIHRTGPSVVGMSEHTTFASMIAGTANFYRSAVKPQLTFMGEVFTEHLCPRFGESDLVCYWPDPTMDDPDMLLRKWTAAMEKQAATPNEFRDKVLNMEPFEEGGDDPMAQAGVSPIPFATGDDYADVPIPALDAQDGARQDEAAEAAQQPKLLEDQTGGRRQALGEGKPTDPSDRMQAMRHANGKAAH